MSADALTRIHARGHIGIRLGLERMRALLARLGDPQIDLRGVLIAGTNGKGSVAAMVASVLETAGYSTCRSPSPHLHSYRERITVDGGPIGATDLDRLLNEVLAASQPGEVEHGPATEFELLTAAAYLWSARQHIDVVVMEVGLGGRLDASNAWDPDVAAVTNIGLDHQEFLGDTIESVAAEKAAIIKRDARAVTGASGAGLRVIEARASEQGVPLAVYPPLAISRAGSTGLSLRHPRLGRLELPLLGRHQAANAAVALGILDALTESRVVDIPERAIRDGLASTRWPGRLELLQVQGRTILLDGAHNPDGVTALAATIDELSDSLPSGRATFVVGVMADKEVEDMLRAFASCALLREARFIAVGVPDSDRGLPAADLAAEWTRVTGSSAEPPIEDADAALSRGLALTVADGGLLVVAGSLYLVGRVRSRLLPDEALD